MIKLMDMANGNMRGNGTDIAFLNGNRQRYEHYGFVPAGVTYTFNIYGGNWAHAKSCYCGRHDKLQSVRNAHCERALRRRIQDTESVGL